MDNALEIVSCPVCDKAPSKPWLDDGKPTLYQRCLDCGTVYASPRISSAERHAWLSNNFSLLDGSLALSDSRRPALKLEAGIIQGYKDHGRLLDLGCYTGTLFEYFPELRWESHGVELSPSAAEFANKTHACKVFTGTLEAAQYPPQYFDLITLIDMLYYLDDPFAVIQETYRILKPGGTLAIEIAGQSYELWRNYGLVSWLFDRKWSRAGTDSSYLYWFGPKGLQRLLHKCGLVVSSWYVVPSPRRTNLAMNMVASGHYTLMKWWSRLSTKALTWAPKYLCIAQKPNYEP
jgi:SAM-dependent methyltransferase